MTATATAPQPAPARFDRAPAIVIWEATRACGLACRHCRAEAVTARAADELTTDEAKALFTHIRDEFGPTLVVITGGDPLERPDALAIARHGADLGLRLAITPAATPKLGPDTMLAIADAGVGAVALSVDGADARTHDRFRGVDGTWRRTVDAFAWAHWAGLSTQMNTSFGRHDADQVQALAQLGALSGIAMWSAFILVPTGRATPDMLLAPAEHEKLYRELAEIALDPATPFAVKTTAGQPFYRVLAQRGASSDRQARWRGRGVNDGNGFVFIAQDGAICPSGFLPLARGNVRTHRLADVYRDDEVFRRLRRPSTFAGKCGWCPHNEACGGSRSRAYALTGDPFASDPTCVYRPRAPAGRQEKP